MRLEEGRKEGSTRWNSPTLALLGDLGVDAPFLFPGKLDVCLLQFQSNEVEDWVSKEDARMSVQPADADVDAVEKQKSKSLLENKLRVSKLWK